MKHINLGILAHVDAGKTTLSEALLYTCGNLRHLGRVDSRDTFLDTYSMERKRGITIFSKQANLTMDDFNLTLLDTPGHVDFGAEAERVLQVLDYCILVISGASGVQGHTRTIWRLLEEYKVPTFIFVNKMDQPGTDCAALLSELKDKLSDTCVDFSNSATGFSDDDMEAIAVCDEELMERYLETGEAFQENEVASLVSRRKLFPVFFGSALKLSGVEELINGLKTYTVSCDYPNEFGARVFKITRDEQGNRMTHMKITGGSIKPKEMIGEEKINQIRLYSGEKYETLSEAVAGTICTLTGLNNTHVGDGLGIEVGTTIPTLEPVLTYKVTITDGSDPVILLRNLRILEEEDPQLHVILEERHNEILVQVMGEVGLEILQNQILERFNTEVTFDTGSVVYKETIQGPVEGVGHFEPLRHYAEVHLLLEPLDRGSGMIFATDCSEDILDKNWQRLILTHLEEKTHRGVLTGSAITDMKITVITGRAHQKHTEGGDFRQATYRAVRQGLMYAQSILLEPFYNYRIELPVDCIGRAMTDLERMNAIMDTPVIEDIAVLTGTAPVTCIQNYAKELSAYTKGLGQISLTVQGYGVCHNAEEVIASSHYLPEADLRNTPDSVFCAHGSGFVVPWNEVYDYMHVESAFNAFSKNNILYEENQNAQAFQSRVRQNDTSVENMAIGTDEVDAILDRTFYSNSSSSSKAVAHKKNGIGHKQERIITAPTDSYDSYTYSPAKSRDKYLLVDGYNIIFAWKDLNDMAATNIDSARSQLLDIMCNYQGTLDSEIIVVFDAYRVKGHDTEILDYHNIHVVFTKEAETADQFIEKFAHENGKKYDVTVATSDSLEQIIIRGKGCRLVSAREFETLVKEASHSLKTDVLAKQTVTKNYLSDNLSDNAKQIFEQLKKNDM